MRSKYDMKPINYRIFRAILDYVVLKLIENGTRHGYGLIKAVRKQYGVWFGPSTMYPLLEQLGGVGLIESTWAINNNKPTKNYTLTPEGRTYLRTAQPQLEMTLSLLNNGLRATKQETMEVEA